jgi:CubicO group peptidase (beta-lactamase class C family)
MKRNLIVILVIFIGVQFCFGADLAKARQTAPLTDAVDGLFSEWDVAGSPGGAVVLTDHGQVILERCYGLADIEHGVPITPETRFELASVSKPFTAFGVLLLEQAGKVKISDDIREYLPELPDYGSPITIADLLHHTSGLSDWVRVRPYAGQTTLSGFGMEDLLTLVSHQRILEFEPGSKWSYSNTNYALLAEIVARVTNRPFGEWMHDRVFQPLAMDHTSFPTQGTCILPDRANAYYRASNQEYVRSFVEAFEIPGPAHAFSTIDDMAKWTDNLRTGRVGGAGIVEKMRTTTTLTNGEQSFYGAGLGIGSYRGVKTIGHSGQTGAFKTELLYCPDLQVGVVVLANSGWMRADDMARRILDLYLVDELEPLEDTASGADEPDESASYEMNPAEYERFLGGYRLDADPSVLLAVAREGEWLVGVIVGEGLDFFRPVAALEFENRHHNCHLTFVAGEDHGHDIARVLVNLRGQEMWATRVPLPHDPEWIDECAGLYYSTEIEAAYEIAGDADHGITVRIPHSESRPLCPIEADLLAGGIGILRFLRGDKGNVVGFDFAEPEDLNARLIRFKRCECAR